MSSRVFTTAGWWGYFICAAIYVVAGIRAGDWLGLAGSFFFLAATVCFLVQYYRDTGGRSDD